MKRNVEHYVWLGTSIGIVLAVILAVTALVFDQLSMLTRYEPVFAWSARVLVAGLIVTVMLGWVLTVRYLLSKNRMPASPADYVLLLVAIFMPIAAIYVLRAMRRREETSSHCPA